MPTIRTGCMVPPATMTALASCTTLEKWTAGFNSRNFILHWLNIPIMWIRERIEISNKFKFYLQIYINDLYVTVMNLNYTNNSICSSAESQNM